MTDDKIRRHHSQNPNRDLIDDPENPRLPRLPEDFKNSWTELNKPAGSFLSGHLLWILAMFAVVILAFSTLYTLRPDFFAAPGSIVFPGESYVLECLNPTAAAMTWRCSLRHRGGDAPAPEDWLLFEQKDGEKPPFAAAPAMARGLEKTPTGYRLLDKASGVTLLLEPAP